MTDDELLAAWKAGELRVIGCDQCDAIAADCPPMSNSVAALASKANVASNRYRELVDAKASYYVLRSAGNELRAATDALVSAIVDAMS